MDNSRFKFRAWCEALKKMDYSSLNAIGFDGKVWYGNADITGFHSEIMQYTGLKDKNGKEIWEGDIIEGGYLNPLTDEFYSKKYLVEFKNGCFKGKNIKNSPFGDTWLWFIKGEVIGNIYENPELLGG